ncbi:hypothetical protein AAFG13_10980 [Bradyrhizobium sp. B124]|uniref:hypothetical protein n=1 Tax=Bradyrhizobium sp. B124 TaxID=3140245 RepID=UPI00318389E6
MEPTATQGSLRDMGTIRNSIAKAVPWIEPVLDYFDWKKQVISILSGFAMVGWSFVKDLAWPVIVTLGIVTMVTVAYGLMFPAFLKLVHLGVNPRPDHSIWRHRKEFRLDEAACLLANVEPVHSYSVMDGNSKAWLSLLCEAVKLKEIERIPDKAQDPRNTYGGQYRPDENTIINADQLKRFCTAHGRKPEFLN